MPDEITLTPEQEQIAEQAWAAIGPQLKSIPVSRFRPPVDDEEKGTKKPKKKPRKKK